MTVRDGSGQPTTQLEPLLSVSEARDVLRISESGVYRLMRRGELASVKVGGRTLIEPAAIRAFIAERRTQHRDANGSDA
jgi:excisionase family DNA binding protein